jgi:hypothetical protein
MILVNSYISAKPFFATDLWGLGIKAVKIY